jgi:hypothetical protein
MTIEKFDFDYVAGMIAKASELIKKFTKILKNFVASMGQKLEATQDPGEDPRDDG